MSLNLNDSLPPYEPTDNSLPLLTKDAVSSVDLELHQQKQTRKRNLLRKHVLACFGVLLLVSVFLSMHACGKHKHLPAAAAAQQDQQLGPKEVIQISIVDLKQSHKEEEQQQQHEQSTADAPVLAKRAFTDPNDSPIRQRDSSPLARRALTPADEEANKKKLEKAQQEIDQIKKEEESKKGEALQKRLTILEREVAIADQQNYKQDLGLWPKDQRIEPSGQKIMLLTATDGNGANALIKNVLSMAESNRREYCDYHNYVYKFINMSRFDLRQTHPVWGKLNAIKTAFDEHPNVEWIWWVDVDIIIMDPEIDLARHVLNPETLKRRLSYGRPLKHPSYGEYSNIRTGYNPDEKLPVNAAKPVFDGIESEDYEYANVSEIDLIISQDYWGLNAGSFFIRRSNFIDMLLDYWADPVFVAREFTFREQDTLGHLNINHWYIRKHIGVVPQRMLNSYIADDLWSGYDDGDIAIHFAGCWIPGDCDARWQRHWKKRGRVPEKYRNSAGS